MVAFVASILLTTACIAGAFLYARRRPVDAYLTWGEALAAAVFVFFVMFMAYGVVPNQWLILAENEWNWRPDRIFVGPGRIAEKLPFTTTYRVLGDSVAAIIYVVALGAQIALWSAWQNRGRAKPKEIEVSPYGRPLVRKA